VFLYLAAIYSLFRLGIFFDGSYSIFLHRFPALPINATDGQMSGLLTDNATHII